MPVLGIDDTDSRSGGMCTTWIATEVARRLPTGTVDALYLIRLHPAVAYKTRGNGALGIATRTSIANAREIASEVIDEFAVVEDPETNPGLVVIEDDAVVADPLRVFGQSAVRTTRTVEEARRVLAGVDAVSSAWGNGRGVIGATAAAGAVGCHRDPDLHDTVFGDWTYESIAYREHHRWGSERSVSVPTDIPSGPNVWDTIDPVTGDPVCVPHSPCPVLYGIRGDDIDPIRRVSERIDGESIDRTGVFITNQGTDGHLRPGTVDAIEDGHAYRVRGEVTTVPTTREGGHVSFEVQDGTGRCDCEAFAPTGRFRNRIRDLETGDTVIACGEVGRGAIKLEKLALVRRSLTERRNPTCWGCDRSMESAGHGQGYRCRQCGTKRPRKARDTVARTIDRGWYEVPPTARRHLSKPLVRGGFGLPVHPTSG